MEIGATPYPQMSRIDPYATAPLVVTVSDDEWNYVVFLLQDGKPITNFYLHSLAKHTVYVRPGRYQLVTLRGRGWDPEKKMPNGFKGGFDRVNWWLIESDLIVPEAGHQFSMVSLIIACPQVDPRVGRSLRRLKYETHYEKGKLGWCSLRFAVIDLSDGRVYTNSMGAPLANILKSAWDA